MGRKTYYKGMRGESIWSAELSEVSKPLLESMESQTSFSGLERSIMYFFSLCMEFENWYFSKR